MVKTLSKLKVIGTFWKEPQIYWLGLDLLKFDENKWFCDALYLPQLCNENFNKNTVCFFSQEFLAQLK